MCQRPDFLYLQAHLKNYLEAGLWSIYLWVYLQEVYFHYFAIAFCKMDVQNIGCNSTICILRKLDTGTSCS